MATIDSVIADRLVLKTTDLVVEARAVVAPEEVVEAASISEAVSTLDLEVATDSTMTEADPEEIDEILGVQTTGTYSSHF